MNPSRWPALFMAMLLGFPSLNHLSAASAWPSTFPGDWKIIGRTPVQTTSNSICLSGGYAMNDQKLADAEISFQARAPLGTEQVQIWAGFRCRDRDSRYVFALRGGNNNDVYLARYAPDGGTKFLGFAPLDFKPVPGVWYPLRVVFVDDRIQLYINNEKLPRLNLE